MDSRAKACENEGDPDAAQLWRRVGGAIRALAAEDGAAPSNGEGHNLPPDGEADGASDGQVRVAFEATPHAYLLVTPDLKVAAANNAFLAASMTRRDEIVGRALFETFPDNPQWAEAEGMRNLSASLARVIDSGRPHHMGVQRYDMRRPDGVFEERWWSSLNTPAFDSNGRLTLIIHHPQEVKSRGRGRA